MGVISELGKKKFGSFPRSGLLADRDICDTAVTNPEIQLHPQNSIDHEGLGLQGIKAVKGVRLKH